MQKRALSAVALTGVAALAMSACGSNGTTTTDKVSNAATSATDAVKGTDSSTSGTDTASATDTSSTDTASSTDSATGTDTSASGTDTSASDTSTAAAPATPSGTAAPTRDANADLVIWTDADRGPTLTKVAQDFGNDQGIKVSVQIAPETRQQFEDATKVGNGPDVVVGAHDWLGEFVQNGVVAPIPLDADTASKMQKNAMAAASFNGQNYGVPYATENLALMRNTALAPNAPASFDELIKMGTDAKAKSGGKVTNVLAQPVGKTGNGYYTYPYLSACGGGIFGQKANGDYDPAKLLVASPESIKGAQYMGVLGKQGVLSTNVGDDNAEGLFDDGKAPFMITGPWGVTNAKTKKIKYAVSPLPTIPGCKAMQPFLGVQLFYVSAKAKNAALAQEFVTKWITKKDVQMQLFQALNRPPALTEAYNEAAAQNADVKAFGEAGKDAKPMPNIPAMNSVWKPFGQAAADVVAGKDAATRFAAAAKEITANIAKG